MQLFGEEGLVKAGSRLPTSCRPSSWREGALAAPADPAGPLALAREEPQDAGSEGAPGRDAPLRPCPRPPHSAHSFAPSGPRCRSREAVRTPAFKEPLGSSCRRRSPPPSFPFLSRPAHPGGRETVGGGGRKPLPAALSERLHRTAQRRRAGLAPVNSGGLCSRQLFPGHLTCQLLGKRCR